MRGSQDWHETGSHMQKENEFYQRAYYRAYNELKCGQEY